MAGRDLSAELFGAPQQQGVDLSQELFGPVPQAQPTETGGFFGSFGTSLKERAATAIPTAKLYTGLGDQKAATDELLRARKESNDAFKQTEFSEIGDAFKMGDYGGALSKTVDKFKEVAGSSFGSMAPAAAAGLGARVAAGAGATALGVGALPAAAIGTAAFGLVTLGSYIADNLGRQKEELDKEGKRYQDVNRLPASVAAMGQTALDVVGFKMFKPLGALVGMEGKEVAQKTAQEIVQAANKPGAYAKAVARGTATGIAFEVPQEVTQQVLERWQAGLPLDPFTDPEAAKEYMEAAGGALLLGGPMGAYSGAKTTYDLRNPPKEEEPGWTKDLEEGKYDRKPITTPGGEGAGVAGEPDTGAPAAGPGGAQPGTMVPPGPDAGVPPQRESQPTPPVDESQLSKWEQRAKEGREGTSLERTETVSTKYGEADVGLPEGNEPAGLWADQEVGAQVTAPAAETAPAAPTETAPASRRVETLEEFRKQYDALRAELSDPEGGGEKLVLRDMQRLVDDNHHLLGPLLPQYGTNKKGERFVKDKGYLNLLLSPTYPGSELLDQVARGEQPRARATQGNLFGSFVSAARRARAALALAGQDTAEAVTKLRESRDRIQQKLDSGGYDDAFVMREGRGMGMNGAEALKNRDSIVQNYVTRAFEEIDQAIASLERRAGPRAMQGELFGTEGTGKLEPSKIKEAQTEEYWRLRREAAAQLEEEFGAPVPGEVFADEEIAPPSEAAPAAPQVEKKEKVEAPKVSTEHVAGTREGEKLEEFFNLIESSSESEQQVKNHQGLLSSILNMLLEYDIVEPGQKSSPALGKIYDHLASLFGGRTQFNELITKLRTAGPEVQSALFKRAGVPDLTTYRGLAEFQKDLQTYIAELGSTGEGFKIPTRSQQKLVGNLGEKQAPLFPRAEETLPFTSDVDFLEYELRTYPDVGGEPRKPEVVNIEQKYKIKDFKLRSAWALLKSIIAQGKKGGKGAPRKEQTAAYSYLTNKSYDSFGQMLNSLAQDLASWEEYQEQKYGMPYEQLRKIPEDQRVVVDKNAELDIGENSNFPGEGGRYAENFRQWIEGNLSDSTVRILNRLVKRHRENNETMIKHREAKAEYKERQKQRATEREQERRENKARETATRERRRSTRKKAEAAAEAAEKAGANVPKAPEHEDIDVSEETEEVMTPELGGPFKNRPVLMDVSTELGDQATKELKAGNLKAVLRMMANTAAAKVNKYYAELAKRLLDAGITAKSRVIGIDHMEPLSNEPGIQETLDNYLDLLEQAVLTSVPKDEQADILDALKSKKLAMVGNTVERLEKILRNDAHKQIARNAFALLDEQYNWLGKYDPVTDTVVLRTGYIKNGLVLHEALHAALSQLLDNPQNLQGARKAAYDQLVSLYNYAKQILNQQGFANQEGVSYGLTDLHEFVSEALTNPEFQAMLRKLRFKASPFSMMTSFVQAVKKLFGVKDGPYTNVLYETIKASDVLMPGGISNLETMEVKGQPRAMMATSRVLRKTKAPIFRAGRPNSPSAMGELMKSTNWNNARVVWENFRGAAKPVALGILTLRQIDDLVRGRIPQIRQFIDIVENYMSRKNAILRESGEISKRWERLQSKNPELSRLLGRVMHRATMVEVDPDKATLEQRNAQPELMKEWAELKKNVNAVNLYRDVRDFYAKRYEEYQTMMLNRLDLLGQKGVPENTIAQLRKQFEAESPKGPYFPLVRYGKFWYQVGKGATREYYMFERLGDRNKHMEQTLKDRPELKGTEFYGDNYKDLQAYQTQHLGKANFVSAVMDAIDSTKAGDKSELKDAVYQAYLSNMPERSFRKQFIHRQNIAGYSEDALRNFASSSFHMAYQLSRFEYSPEMYARVEAAKLQLKERRKEAGADRKVMAESTELEEYVNEMQLRLDSIMNPPDVNAVQRWLSNAGFIWYLTAPASAVTNVLGGMIIGLPTLVGHYTRMYPGIPYSKAVLTALMQIGKSVGQVMSTGFKVDVEDKSLVYPSMDRNDGLTKAERIAYDRFVADGVIDITAAYDQAGLAGGPTERYSGAARKAMERLSSLFHNAERFNREVMAMSAFRAALASRKDYSNQEQAIAESIAEAKDLTHRAMFDYSSPNKPRYFQNPTARVVTQFKQFPQQMTFFLAHNFVNMIKGESPEVRREATARFVGTMGMAGIFSGVTGLWGFSTVAAIVNAVMNNLGDEDDEKEPFDFELEFANWAAETFGNNMGTLLTRGIGNAAGIDIASRVKLDDMWFRDGRKNLDEAEALQGMIIELLGPTVGLAVNAAEAAKLWNEGHGDRALETVMPALIKQPLVAYRYSQEGAKTLQGETMLEELSPFELAMQSIGLRPAQLAELQFYNITVKGQEQEILKKRQNLMNLYGLAFMANDDETLETALDKIDRFNNNYPDVNIPMKSLNESVKERLKKSSQTDSGLYLDKKLRNVLDKYSYAKQ